MDLELINQFRKLALIAILADDLLESLLVLKGSGAMRFAYDLDMRSSIDLDFSLRDDFPKNGFNSIRERVK